MTMAEARALVFTSPRTVAVRAVPRPKPGPGEALVENMVSAISSGSELLVYRGQFVADGPDPHDEISSGLQYPLSYGYASVGRVAALGTSVDPHWMERLVFGFHPHGSHFIERAEQLLPVPEGQTAESACFLPSMETAANLVQDAAPILGERALVLGQGVVGLLTAALLRQFPLSSLVTSDLHGLRREASLELGVAASLDPGAIDFAAAAHDALGGPADLSLELSGAPAALDSALALTGFTGRIVIGSWYGSKRAPIDLGGKFHRSRIRLISSQVSTIAPELSGRWDKARRFAVAWKALERIRPERWITHRYSLDQAPEAYRLLDENPTKVLQAIFIYT
jgi:2-desacetyl-2-hydroxyethyl bacteriochlorophyllide A dehydrogenase